MRVQAILGLLLAALSVSIGYTQPFTYQGFLRQGGNPTNGTFSMTFTLFNHPTNTGAGAQVGSPITLNNVAVQNGLFTVELDFGSVWDGSERWLEIRVGATTLSPRVKITRTPYAARADAAPPIGAAGGDLSGSYPNPTVASLQGRSVSNTAPNEGQVLKWDGSAWSPADDLRDAFWRQGMFGEIFYNGWVGVGRANPHSPLHVYAGFAGQVTAAGYTVLTIENNNHAYLSFLTPDGNERGILFGQPSSNVAGGVIYNNPATPNGLQFRTNGNATRMVIDGSGNVGIGTNAPAAPLSLGGGLADTKLALWQGGAAGDLMGFGVAPDQFRLHLHHSGNRFSFLNAPNGSELVTILGNGKVGIGTSSPSYPLHVVTSSDNTSTAILGYHGGAIGNIAGVTGQCASTDGAGVAGIATATSGLNAGVFGTHTSSDGAAVFAYGRFVATGVKLFHIDHPLRPETHYLNHFCTEGPEPYNAYSGNVVTDAQGYALVQLPDYFESINRDFRYQLTCIGQFAQAIVAEEIKNNRFVIRTDKPNVKVSWRVEAVRNDRWVQRHGFQAEQEKPEGHQGKYLHPELYGQPKEMGIYYRPEPQRANEGEAPK